MKVRRLNLWEVSKQSYRTNNIMTSVLASRAGVKSKHYGYLYSSREQSAERKTESPGVSLIMQNAPTAKNTVADKPAQKGTINLPSQQSETRRSIMDSLRDKFDTKITLNTYSKPREQSVENGLKTCKSHSNLYVPKSLKLGEKFQPVRQTQKNQHFSKKKLNSRHRVPNEACINLYCSAESLQDLKLKEKGIKNIKRTRQLKTEKVRQSVEDLKVSEAPTKLAHVQTK